MKFHPVKTIRNTLVASVIILIQNAEMGTKMASDDGTIVQKMNKAVENGTEQGKEEILRLVSNKYSHCW